MWPHVCAIAIEGRAHQICHGSKLLPQRALLLLRALPDATSASYEACGHSPLGHATLSHQVCGPPPMGMCPPTIGLSTVDPSTFGRAAPVHAERGEGGKGEREREALRWCVRGERGLIGE